MGGLVTKYSELRLTVKVFVDTCTNFFGGDNSYKLLMSPFWTSSNIAYMSDDMHTFPAQTFYQKCPILVPEICSSHPYTFCKYWFLPPASPLAALEVLDRRMTETQDCNNIWWSRTDNKMNNSHLFAAVLGTVCSSCENDILRTVVRKMRNSTVSVMDWSLSLFGMLVTVHTISRPMVSGVTGDWVQGSG